MFQMLDVFTFKTPQRKWASSRQEGITSWSFLELRQVLSTYDGDLRNPLWWPQERPLHRQVALGTLGIPFPSMPGPKTLCGVSAGT